MVLQSHGSSEVSPKLLAGSKVPQLYEGEVPTMKECRIWDYDDDEMVLKGVVSIANNGWKSQIWIEDKNSKVAFPMGNTFKEWGQAEMGCRAWEAANLGACSVHLCIY